jgi:hypothetical protein
MKMLSNMTDQQLIGLLREMAELMDSLGEPGPHMMALYDELMDEVVIRGALLRETQPS